MSEPAVRRVRVAAYAVCVRDGAVLLAGGITEAGTEWTLPGGGLDHGEDPRDGAVREVEEETGYAVRLDALLVADGYRLGPGAGRQVDLHAVRIIYAGTVVGGELRFEIGGSTDRAAWIPLSEVPALGRADVIDVGLAAWDRHSTLLR